MRHDQRRALSLRNDVRHRKSFPRAGDPEKGLGFFILFETGDEFGDGLGLVASGGEGGVEGEFLWH